MSTKNRVDLNWKEKEIPDGEEFRRDDADPSPNLVNSPLPEEKKSYLYWEEKLNPTGHFDVIFHVLTLENGKIHRDKLEREKPTSKKDGFEKIYNLIDSFEKTGRISAEARENVYQGILRIKFHEENMFNPGLDNGLY